MKYLEKKFSEDNLPSLKEVVFGALELFSEQKPEKIKFKNFKKRAIIGSGNAILAGKILFQNPENIFATENDFEKILEIEGIDGITILSASGGKHSSIMAKFFKEKGYEIELVTCTENSKTEQIIGRENCVITKKNPEPYTYNTSTYLGWILGVTGENPQEILEFLTKLEDGLGDFDFTKFNGFLFALPSEFGLASGMIDTKFIELFGRKISRDIKTFEELKHACSVVVSENELLIKFGTEKVLDNLEIYFNGEELEIQIPENFGYAGILFLGYFVSGKIQEQMPDFFRESIGKYVEYLNNSDFGKGTKIFG
ncbi:hypothetical protein LR002_03080 [Candidatus Gracilibacteria bacterium]|nr:hypothetical protein [Candidatus Gracilibacteria bacterium]